MARFEICSAMSLASCHRAFWRGGGHRTRRAVVQFQMGKARRARASRDSASLWGKVEEPYAKPLRHDSS
jgi:hypothetical protein